MVRIWKYETHSFHRTCSGGIAVAIGFHLSCAGDGEPYSQSISSAPSSPSQKSQSSTYTPTPTPSSGSNNTSRLERLSCIFNLRSATMRSSARGVAFGGSSRICSQPMGGDPGGDIRKFFSIGGGRRNFSSNVGDDGEKMGLGSERYTRKTVGVLRGGVRKKHKFFT